MKQKPNFDFRINFSDLREMANVSVLEKFNSCLPQK